MQLMQHREAVMIRCARGDISGRDCQSVCRKGTRVFRERCCLHLQGVL